MNYYIALQSKTGTVVHPTLLEARDDEDALRQARGLRYEVRELHLVERVREVALPKR